MPIRFTLHPREETGIESARAIVAKSEYLGADRDPECTKLRAVRILRAKSMPEIMTIIGEVAPAVERPIPHPSEPLD